MGSLAHVLCYKRVTARSPVVALAFPRWHRSSSLPVSGTRIAVFSSWPLRASHSQIIRNRLEPGKEPGLKLSTRQTSTGGRGRASYSRACAIFFDKKGTAIKMSPDAEDSSSSPEAGIDQDSEMMLHEKTERASSDDKSPTANGSTPPPVMKPNPKDPSRPRRKKARRACFACQRAHLTCGKCILFMELIP